MLTISAEWIFDVGEAPGGSEIESGWVQNADDAPGSN